MSFKLIPHTAIRREINSQPDPELAFQNILAASKRKMASVDWAQFTTKHLKKDITAARKWIEQSFNGRTDIKGIYLGLDTLNMDEGEGTNVEIGLNLTCDPTEMTMEWSFDCDYYGDSHLIEGLYAFEPLIKSTGKYEDTVEYIIFLAYSGLVLREALLKVKFKSNFISCWGFHDGDMYLLLNKIGTTRSMLVTKNVD